MKFWKIRFLLTCFFLLNSFANCSPKVELPEYFMQKYKTVHGKSSNLAEFSDKTIALYFWSSDCLECKDSNRIASDLLKDFGSGITQLGVNTDKQENQARAVDIALKFGITYDSLYDPDLSLVQILQIERQPALGLLIISKNGIGNNVLYDLTESNKKDLLLKINEIKNKGEAR